MSRRRTIGPYPVKAGSENRFFMSAVPGEEVPVGIEFYAGGNNILIADIVSAKESQFASVGSVNAQLFDHLPLWLRSLRGMGELEVKLMNPGQADLDVTVYVDFAEPAAQAKKITLICPFQVAAEEGSTRKLFISRPACGGRLKELRMMPDCRRHLGRELKVDVSVYNTDPATMQEVDGTRDLYSLRATVEGNIFGSSALVRKDGVIELGIDDDHFWRDVRPDDFMIVMEYDRHL